ncbi:MAG TPA: HAD family phosphatase [Vicinamibacterales bacterium]|nr:HAD family phosphatase [Vicinamibacterales bacterium]
MSGALQAIVFDFDGVIADSEPLHLKAFQQALAEEGIALERDDYFARYLGYDDVGMFQALGSHRGLAWTDRHITALVARKGMKLQAMIEGDEVLFPGAAAFIRAAAAEVPIAIASGALRHEIVQIVESAGLGGLFATIVASGDTPESKPSPGPYLLAFEQLQQTTGRVLDRRRCIAIEDSIWGLESARGAGLRCVGVTTSYGAGDLAGAELVVDSLKSLTIPMLERLVA